MHLKPRRQLWFKNYNTHPEAGLHFVKRHLLAVHNGETDATLVLFSDESWVCSQ